MSEKNKTIEFLNQQLVTSYRKLEYVDWRIISYDFKLSEDFIREFKDKVHWDMISSHQKLSENFIREFADKLDWCWISQYQQLSEDFIREFQDKVKWSVISIHQKLSEDFIREFADKVDWYWISTNQNLSEDFIREFGDNLYCTLVSKHQKLSESFIREFANDLNWDCISIYQQLSEDFIREFADKVNWFNISKYQKLSQSFINEFKDRLDISEIEDNWNYKDKEFLKQAVIDTGLYECYDDYFIAYKGIRRDRYSKYNYRYQYMPDETYEAWCDCSSEENSCGLSVWTEDDARYYCNELVVKVKINYEDVGRVVHEGGKIRCRKLTVID